jgi:hypothetical protein
MSSDLPNNPIDRTKADTAASDACTRSGAFVLLLTAVLFLLTHAWEHRPKEIAFAHYLDYRLSLELFVDTLKEDTAWEKFKESVGDAESVPLAQLPSQFCVGFGASAAAGKAQEQPSVSHGVGVGQGRAPVSPPTPGRKIRPPSAPPVVTACIPTDMSEIAGIADLLRKLNDPQLLAESRGYSNFYAYSIARWATRRDYLAYRNSFTHACPTKEADGPHQGQIHNDALLECLTMRDVLELAQFERPPITDPNQIGGSVGREIEITPGSFPRDLASASIFAEALLFFALIYFGAFAREAALSPSFPAPGTLFSAFSRSRWTLPVLLLALWSPFFASAAVAITSRQPWLVFCGVLIFGAVVSAHLVLQRKSYFGALNLRKRLGRVANKAPRDPETSEQGPDRAV